MNFIICRFLNVQNFFPSVFLRCRFTVFATKNYHFERWTQERVWSLDHVWINNWVCTWYTKYINWHFQLYWATASQNWKRRSHDIHSPDAICFWSVSTKNKNQICASCPFQLLKSLENQQTRAIFECLLKQTIISTCLNANKPTWKKK